MPRNLHFTTLMYISDSILQRPPLLAGPGEPAQAVEANQQGAVNSCAAAAASTATGAEAKAQASSSSQTGRGCRCCCPPR
jgi:hypothetical protein